MEDFCFETVLSADRNLNLYPYWRPDDKHFCVMVRAEAGGHDVPDDKIISRFDKAWECLNVYWYGRLSGCKVISGADAVIFCGMFCTFKEQKSDLWRRYYA